MSKRLIFCADFDPSTGYGIHAERIVHDFLSFGYDVRVRPTRFNESSARVSDFVKERLVFDVQPEPWELMLHYPSIPPTPGKKVAYFTMAETTDLSKDQLINVNKAEFLIVPCGWNAQSLKRSGVTVPIHVVHLGFNEKLFKPSRFPSGCVFGTAGKIAHGKSRKGLNTVIDCFLKAFPSEPASLIVKCFPECDVKQVSDPRISYIRKYLTDLELAEFFGSLTCFVSASRGEGFGLMQLESCASGKPVIASIFGGLTEFLNNQNCFPVSYSLVDADEKYSGRGQWAMPSNDCIVSQMRRIYSNPKDARSKGEIAAESVKSFTWTRSNRSLEAVLKSRGIIDYPTAPKLIFSNAWGRPSKPQEIIIRRSNAFGDVLAATCVAERLISMGHEVVFQTIRACQPILKYSPRIKKVEDTNARDCHINLDGAYENHPDKRNKTFSEIYVESANKQLEKYGFNIDTHLQSTPSLVAPNKTIPDELVNLQPPLVMICPKSANWDNRTIPDKTWENAASHISGTKIWLGMEPAPDGIVDLKVRSIDSVIRYLAWADLLVTVDTGPMHIAAALGIPIVAIEQASSPRLHLSDQRDFMVVSPQLNCLNCQIGQCPIDSDKPPCQNIDPLLIARAVNERLLMYEPSVSAVIPIYNTDPARLNRCLECVIPQVDQVVIAVDGDGKIPVGIISNPKISYAQNWTGKQLGYGRNANHGARHTFGEWILFLNDDVFLGHDYVDQCLNVSDRSDKVGAVAGLLRYPNGLIQHGGTRRGGMGWGHIDHNQSNPTITETCEMENVTHAAIMIRRAAFYKAMAYPEHYDKAYWEDNHLNMAIRKAGYKIMYCPQAEGIHEEHQTTKSLGREGFSKVVDHNRNLFMHDWGDYFGHNKDESVIGNFDYLK